MTRDTLPPSSQLATQENEFNSVLGTHQLLVDLRRWRRGMHGVVASFGTTQRKYQTLRQRQQLASPHVLHTTLVYYRLQ